MGEGCRRPFIVLGSMEGVSRGENDGRRLRVGMVGEISHRMVVTVEYKYLLDLFRYSKQHI